MVNYTTTYLTTAIRKTLALYNLNTVQVWQSAIEKHEKAFNESKGVDF